RKPAAPAPDLGRLNQRSCGAALAGSGGGYVLGTHDIQGSSVAGVDPKQARRSDPPQAADSSQWIYALITKSLIRLYNSTEPWTRSPIPTRRTLAHVRPSSPVAAPSLSSSACWSGGYSAVRPGRAGSGW